MYGNIDRASGLCRAQMDGGPSRFGWVDPMRGDATRLARLCEDIEDFRGLAASRLAAVAHSGAGTSVDQAYEPAFARILDRADADIAMMARQIDSDGDRIERLAGATTVLLAGLFAAVAVLARRKRKTTEARAHERALREDREAHLATIVEGSEDAIVSTTLEGEILTWNPGAHAMLGYTAEEMVGQPITRVVPPAAADRQGDLAGQVRQGLSATCADATLVRKDGSRVAVAATVSPIRRNGAVVAMSARRA